MSTWWRRNRWALLALPFLIVLAGAASSYRIITSWQPWQLTDPVEGAAGEQVRLVDEIVDAGDGYTIDVLLGAGPAQQVTSGTDTYGETQAVPEVPGTVVWRTDLTVTADPDVILTGCQLRLVDDQGRETAYSSVRPGISLSLSPCVPADTPGPVPESIFELEENPAPRPETYTLPLLFRTADDFVPARLDVFWERPTYAALQLTAEPAPDQGATSSDTTEPEEG